MTGSLWLELVGCVLVADFVTGVVHWWEDTYGDPRWKWIGAWIIEPNIEHHEHPTRFVRMSNLALRNYQPILAAAAVLITAVVLGVFSWHWMAVAAFGACGNEVHGWAHVRPKHWLPRLLQDMCLVQTPQHHGRHHKRPYDVRFCSLTNWLNPPLDLLRFWRGLEFVLSTVGIHPKRLSPERRGV